jgi:glycine dehydrogenase subunit 1
MRYVQHSETEKKEMLNEIGVDGFKELLKDLPGSKVLSSKLNVNKAMSEQEVKDFMSSVASANSSMGSVFLGAGYTRHFIPSVVSHLAGRSEFYTAYTPYQPEISQGMLQAIFEYQTMICRLTGLDIANASLYDGSSALAEAMMMAVHTNSRKTVLISRTVHPHYRRVVKTYADANSLSLVEVDYDDSGRTDFQKLNGLLDETVSAVIVQSPNFFGIVEDIGKISVAVEDAKSVLVQGCTDLVSLGILKTPGESGVDIFAGEGQCMGSPVTFGGPSLGVMACTDEFLRKIPGRLVGQTKDSDENRGFILTMQAREQHIRREKATSNICSNEALVALASTIYFAALGPKLKDMAEINLQKANYAKDKLESAGLKSRFTSSFFNEFVVEADDSAALLKKAREKGIVIGLDLSTLYPELKNCILLNVTELHSKKDIDDMVKVVSGGASE